MALFEQLARRVEERTRAMAEAALRNLETAIREIPDVHLRIEGDTLVIEAKGLLRRWLSDVRLRFAFWRRG